MSLLNKMIQENKEEKNEVGISLSLYIYDLVCLCDIFIVIAKYEWKFCFEIYKREKGGVHSSLKCFEYFDELMSNL